ncbi:MAG: oligosaccharide flippase family protein [Planctomycetes bacterium]|nr:oligosaccharide flippase family protein [Planctomycetota bacterium]
MALAINIAVQILLVRHLSKVEFGSFAFAISVVAVGANLSLLGLNKSFSRFGAIYHEQRDYARLAGTAVLVLATVIGLGIAFVLVIVSSRHYLGGTVIENELSLTLLLTLIVLVPVDSMDAVFQSCFSVFAEVRVVFFRRHILGPGLKLAAVLLVIGIGADVQTLAACYLGAGLLGFLLYASVLVRMLRRKGLFQYFRPGAGKMPVRELFAYSLPLFSSQFCFLFRGALVVLLLEVMRGSESVAEFRAVLPFARLNLVVLQSFLFLFTPLASRMFVRNEPQEISELFWRSTIWVAVLTFPVFLITAVFAEPLTVFMLGDRYAGSAIILSLLAVAFYFDAILGFCGQTLRVFAKVRQIVLVDLASLSLAVVLNLLLIPLYGATGAAVALCAGIIGQNIGYLICICCSTSVGKIQRRFVPSGLSFVIVGGLLVAVQWALSPPLFVAVALVAAGAMLVFYMNRSALAADTIFPQIARLPILGRMVATRANVAE